MVSTLAVVNYLCTCIAVNLMLIVCFKINPIEKRTSNLHGSSAGLTFQVWRGGMLVCPCLSEWWYPSDPPSSNTLALIQCYMSGASPLR